ncbi:MAG: AI-2E family transporter [Actinobacteria bacterium]|nr:AI-2E family transporter [Actinomycetota bacterium]NBQ59923.1 AI-2E family transporter [Actinomycetota bacterium]NBY83110.1 AI-2E family transporter [Actinomycetota bacterium]NDD78741.1 AI-2E family transporter [Actinomycetota bacterium]
MAIFGKPKIGSKLSTLRQRKSSNKPNENLGKKGKPVDTSHPFYFGFMVTTGALLAFTVLQALASASAVFILIVISLFLAAGLNPAVLFFQNRGLNRGASVGAVMGLVLIFVGVFIAIAVPPLIDQGNQLINNAPQLVKDLNNNALINDLNARYGIVDSLQNKIDSVIKDGQFAITAFGGVIGVGKAVVSGLVSALTILVLTLYFLASLPQVVNIGLRFISASRRDRVSKLVNAIIIRVGAFVGGQAIIAALAALFILIMGLIISMPYSGPLAMVVLICGFIPLIGHFIGMGIVTLVSLTKSPTTAIIALSAYIIYVQIENYVITPKIMRKSLAIPGLVTIIAALLGTSLLGLIGGLLAVPIAAAILLILDEVVFPRAQQS